MPIGRGSEGIGFRSQGPSRELDRQQVQ